jgi:hypothetical protein
VRYFANVGPARGPVLYRTVPGAIDVLEAPDKPMPIGMALSLGRDAAGCALGCALWALVVHDEVVRGRWVIVNREFHPAR